MTVSNLTGCPGGNADVHVDDVDILPMGAADGSDSESAGTNLLYHQLWGTNFI